MSASCTTSTHRCWAGKGWLRGRGHLWAVIVAGRHATAVVPTDLHGGAGVVTIGPHSPSRVQADIASSPIGLDVS